MVDFERRTTSGESSWDRCLKDVVDEVQFIVCDAQGKNVVVSQSGNSYSLPRWFSENAFYRYMPAMMAAAEDIFGSQYNFTVLRCVWREERDLDQDNTLYTIERSIVVLECHSPMDVAPKGFQWTSLVDSQISHTEEEATRVLREELGYISRGIVPDLRVAWAQPGWYSDTTTWMCDELQSRSFVVTGPIVQLSVSPWGTVLRASAGSDKFFLKASPCFCNEAAINVILSSVAPLHVANPLVVDSEKRIFIATDHGESVRKFRLSESELTQLLMDLAHLQKESTKKIKELRQAGLPMYETRWVAENLDFLLDHKELDFMKESAELQSLRSNREEARGLLLKLDGLCEGMPMTIVHDDLWLSGNVYRTKDGAGRFGFFDWDCAFIALPLFGLTEWSSGEGAAAAAYLEKWTAFQSVTSLREAVPLADKLHPIFGAFRGLYDLLHMEEHCRPYCRLIVRSNVERASSCISRT